MTTRPRLDGAVPLEHGSSQEVALAALTRRVADLEHRLNMMKIIIGLVLAAKVLLVAFVLYVVFGGRPFVRSGGPVRTISQTAGRLSGARDREQRDPAITLRHNALAELGPPSVSDR